MNVTIQQVRQSKGTALCGLLSLNLSVDLGSFHALMPVIAAEQSGLAEVMSHLQCVSPVCAVLFAVLVHSDQMKTRLFTIWGMHSTKFCLLCL